MSPADLVESVTSPYQRIDVYDTEFFGKVLVIDDDLMLTERDEASYHEMLAHVPLNHVPNARNVLIIGGGDGGLCAQVLRHPNVQRVTLVDIDQAVLDVSERHFPELARGCYADPRTTVEIRDAAAWVYEQAAPSSGGYGPGVSDGDKFDVILMDSTDFNAALSIFTRRFHTALKSLLADGGVFVHNLSSLSWNLDGSLWSLQRQQRLYKHTVPFQVYQPTYLSGHYSYLFCSDDVDPLGGSGSSISSSSSSSSDSSGMDWARFAAKGITTRYYNEAVHWAAFALPAFVRRGFGLGLDDAQEVASWQAPPNLPAFPGGGYPSPPPARAANAASSDGASDDNSAGRRGDPSSLASRVKATLVEATVSSDAGRGYLDVDLAASAPQRNSQLCGGCPSNPGAQGIDATQHGGGVGSHVIAEFFGVAPAILNNRTFLEASLLASTRAGSLTVVPGGALFHEFAPYGVTGVAVLEESHMSVHTWPEYGYAAVDVFSCNDTGVLPVLWPGYAASSSSGDSKHVGSDDGGVSVGTGGDGIGSSTGFDDSSASSHAVPVDAMEHFAEALQPTRCVCHSIPRGTPPSA